MSPHGKTGGVLFESGRPSEGKHRYRFDPKRSLVSALRDAELTTAEPFQRMRETFACLHAQKGTSIFKVSRWLGHSSVRTTERHYARYLPDGYLAPPTLRPGEVPADCISRVPEIVGSDVTDVTELSQ